MPGNANIYGDTELFGLRLVFESDTQDALDIALSQMRSGRRPSADKTLRITLSQYAVKQPDLRAGAQSAQLFIAHGETFIEADGVAGLGHCHYSHACAAELPEMIETLALFLAAQAGRVPLHASAILLDGTATVLAGRSGMGKSSLALAASRAGFPVLAEDTIYVQTSPRLRLWSHMRAIHVFEKDAPDEDGTFRFKSGRWKKAVRPTAFAETAEHAMLCVLARGEQAALHSLHPAEAVAHLTAAPEPGYDLYGSRARDAVHALAEGGCWQLVLSRNPDDALALLAARFTAPAGNQAFA